ncbi:hypothetical protein QN277_013239 [Acacia crassicarpa]|uniref:Dirigent protein n=1 Tax=Acacia crassicarpa TaxID=499986 RepID=A0AAE1N2S1_9FABA|nr:hypothetical protein QN277_013239 [Acacia crassicarpa]
MAGSLEKLLPSSFYFSFFLFVCVVGAAKTNGFSRDITPTKIGLRRERLSHLHFYFHDSLGGPNPSAVIVAEAPATNASKTLFGAVVMMDDPLTAGPELNSKTVGRAQGIFASASQSEVGYLMVLTFGFSHGKYNGSTLSVLGRNTIMSEVREMPIVGGSGLFRFARGYAQAHTHSLNFKERAAVVEYNVYVFHY